MGKQGTTVVMVISDLVNMTRASVSCLRRYFQGNVLLIDISRISESKNNAIAEEFQCAVKRLLPFNERQFYAHSTALDFALQMVKTTHAIFLDNDCFVRSDNWESRLLSPFRNNPKCAATGPARGGTVVFGGKTFPLLGTWSTCVRVPAILDTGFSLFAHGSDIVDDSGKKFQLDTLDANLILVARAEYNIEPLDDINDYCFHIGAVTTGNYLLSLYGNYPESFNHYFRSMLRFDSRDMLPMLFRIMINAYHTSRFFGDKTVSKTQYKTFIEREVSSAFAERFENEFSCQILPELKYITGSN